jgi:N6-adenosine-specific RNA methylase IME4
MTKELSTIPAIETYLTSRPDPVSVATELVPHLTAAIELAKTPAQANDLRTMFDMSIRYLRQQLPKAVKTRWDRYDLMHPAESGYVEAAAKAGVLWQADPSRKRVPGPRDAAKSPQLSASEAGFKGARDATRCERAGKLDAEDRRTYYLEMNQDQRHVTLDGAERIWMMMQNNDPAPLSGKYRVIYADPPWDYGNSMPEGTTQPDTHYEPISDAHLAKMNVKDIAEDDAVLFLWVTSPKLEECFPIIRAWGFEYKSAFIWDKVKHNMGHYNSVRHELLLICTRGSCTPDVPELVDSVQTIERGDHSVKPEEFRKIIDRLYPHGKRIELFARRSTEGWDVYGDQV